MKTKICSIFIVLMILLSFVTHAQQKIWGSDNTGVYSVNKDGSDFTYFNRTTGNHFYLTSLVYTSRHYLQAIRVNDINDQFAELFQVTNTGDEYLKLFTFPSTPFGTLVEHTDHYLYGCAEDSLFRIKPDGTNFTNLVFTGQKDLLAGLTSHEDFIYGISNDNWYLRYGWLFSYHPGTNQFQNIFSFNSTTLSYSSSLCIGSDGSFYGIGKNPNPVVFKISPDGTSYSILHDFSDVPNVKNLAVFMNTTGNLVGLVENWSSSVNNIFKLTPDGTFTVLTNRNTDPVKSIASEDINIYTDYFSNISNSHITGWVNNFVGSDDGKHFILPFDNYNTAVTIDEVLPDQKTILSVNDINIGFNNTGSLVKNYRNELFGATINNYSFGGGVLFKVSKEGTKALALIEEGGKYIRGDGLSVYQNWLYATVSSGVGNILRINQDGTDLKKIFQFNGTNGRNPYGKIISGEDGYLYGMTYSGGLNNQGVIYRLKPDGTGFQNIFNFSTSTGKTPYGHLLSLSDGYLYGMTASGGNHDLGVIFKIKKDGSNYTKLLDFDNTNGAIPYGSLIRSKNGSLYGGTTRGPNKAGVIFRINTDGSGFQLVRTLLGIADDLIEDSDGVLYGNTGGAIFSMNNDGTNFKIITTTDNARYPSLVLIDQSVMTPDVYIKDPVDSAAGVNINTNLTIHTGQVSDAYIVQLSKSSDFESLIFSQTASTSVFDIPTLEYGTAYYARARSNAYPLFGKTTMFRTKDQVKRLWGLTGNDGYIYHVNLDGSNFTRYLDSQNGTLDFSHAQNIMQLNDGSIIGTTSAGGSNGWGDVFRIESTGFIKIHDWEQYNYGNATQFIDSGDGYIRGIGATALLNSGRLFSMLSDGSNFQDITFNKYGFSVAGYLTKASNGMFYGLSTGNGPGWIYRIKSDYSGIEQIFTFSSGATGKKPQGELTEGPDHFLYGVLTEGGSHNKGTIFKINLSASQFVKLRDFAGADGAAPRGEIIFDSAGKLYGVTSQGGQFGSGVVYRMNMDGTDYNILHHLAEGSGDGHIVLDKDRILYGSARGGTNEDGFLFALNTDGTAYQKLVSFPVNNNHYPFGKLLLIDAGFDPSQPVALASTNSRQAISDLVDDESMIVYPNPSSNDFTIEVKDDRTLPVELSIVDVNGMILQRTNGNSNEPQYIGGELQPGIYFLFVKVRNGMSVIRKLVKQ